MSSNSNKATTLAENKVLILYILNLINDDISEDNLFEITLQLMILIIFTLNRF